MRGIVLAALAVALAACSNPFGIADSYGNDYGGWYNPGGQFAWQLDLCEKQMETQNVPPMQRKLAMRCCMRDHGVPTEDTEGCAG